MAEQFDITELGESLIQRGRDRRRKQYKRQRKDAWKIALAQGGVNLINRTLAKKADNFLISEEAMAAKARYKSAAEQAQRVINMRDAAQQEGKNMEQYFFDNTYLPEITASFQAKYGDEYKPEDYQNQIRDEAWRLARSEAAEFEDALSKAMSVPDWETAQANINSIISPPRTAGEALIGKVSSLFTDKSSEDVGREVLDQIHDSGMILNNSVQESFDRVLVDNGISEARQFVETVDTNSMQKNEIIVWTSETTTSTATGGAISITKAFIKNPDTDEIRPMLDEEGNHKILHQFVIPEEITSENADRVRMEMIKHNDVFGAVRSGLNPSGQAMFQQLIDEAGIDINNYYTRENYAELAQIYTRINSNESFLVDDERARMDRDIVMNLLSMDESVLHQVYNEEGYDGIVEMIKRIQEAVASMAIGPISNPVNTGVDYSQLLDQPEL